MFAEGSPCGTSLGNTVWQSEAFCLPNRKDANLAFNTLFNKEMNYHLLHYPQAYLPLESYMILLEQNRYLSITGFSNQEGTFALGEHAKPEQTLLWPIVGMPQIISCFGFRGCAEDTLLEGTCNRENMMHDGIDIQTTQGEEVRAPLNGIVTNSGKTTFAIRGEELTVYLSMLFF